MIPVTQTTFGDKVGNCFTACIASLFELSIEEVPNFCCAPEGEWPKNYNDWLAARGMFSVDVMVDPTKGHPLYAMPDGVPCIISGPNANGVAHCVIGKYRAAEGDFVIVHDPNPNQQGIVGCPTSIAFLACLYPARQSVPSISLDVLNRKIERAERQFERSKERQEPTLVKYDMGWWDSLVALRKELTGELKPEST